MIREEAGYAEVFPLVLMMLVICIGVGAGWAFLIDTEFGDSKISDLKETVSFMQTQIAELSTPAPVCSTPEPTRVRPNDNFHLPTEIVKESNG